MSERPFMQLYVSDFIGDTLHLSAEQVGAYMLLLMAMWNAGGALPSDEKKLARVARLSLKKWQAVSSDIMDFFTVEGSEISHIRLTKEIKKVERQSQLRRSAGEKGGRAKSLKDKEQAVASAMPEPYHLPDTIYSSSLRSEEETPSLRSGDAKQSGSKATPESILSAVLSQKSASAVVDHRRKLKKPMTIRAAELLAAKLARVGEIGMTAEQAADVMIDRGWQSFELEWLKNAKPADLPSQSDPLKGGTLMKSGGKLMPTTPERWARRIQIWRQEGEWPPDEWGPPPGAPGCNVPSEILNSQKDIAA